MSATETSRVACGPCSKAKPNRNGCWNRSCGWTGRRRRLRRVEAVPLSLHSFVRRNDFSTPRTPAGKPGGRQECLPHTRSIITKSEEETGMRLFVRFLAGSLLVIGTGLAADFTVGSVTASAGHKVTGLIRVPAGVDAGTNIPVIVVNGAKAGPKLALVAGAHGTEYASIIALVKAGPVGRSSGTRRNADRGSSSECRVVPAKGSAPQSRRWQEYEPAVSRKARGDANGTSLVGDHQGSHRKVRLPDRLSWRRSG